MVRRKGLVTLWCRFRRAGIERMSTGHSHLYGSSPARHNIKRVIPNGMTRLMVRRKGLETLRIHSVKPSRAALIRAAFYCSRPSRDKNNPNPAIRFGLFFFGFGGNYGYNLQRQFDKCTPVTKFVPLGALLYPSKNSCTPSDKSVPQEVPGILGVSVR